MSDSAAQRARAAALHLHGLVAHWSEVATQPWIAALLDWEEQERARRSLERRLKDAQIGRFKPLCDFDWAWPKRCDRAAIEALMALDFLKDATNAILVGPNGVGKSTLARNIAHQALVHGHTVLFTSAGQLLGELAALDSDSVHARIHAAGNTVNPISNSIPARADDVANRADSFNKRFSRLHSSPSLGIRGQ